MERRSSDQRYRWALVLEVYRSGWIGVSHLHGDSLVKNELKWSEGQWISHSGNGLGRTIKDGYGLMRAGLISGPPRKLQDGTVARDLDDAPVIWRVPDNL